MNQRVQCKVMSAFMKSLSRCYVFVPIVWRELWRVEQEQLFLTFRGRGCSEFERIGR